MPVTDGIFILSASQLSRWSRRVADCLEAGDAAETPARLAVALKDLVPFDYATGYVLMRESAPLCIHEEFPQDLEPVKYSESPYLLDPLYERFLDGTLPLCCPLKDIMPDSFEASDYYRYYYSHINAFDEYSFNVPIDGDTTIHFAMTRVGKATRFDRRESSILAAVAPLVSSILSAYYRAQHVTLSGPQGAEKGFHAHLSDVLENFGKAILTRREREIIHLTMRGHSDKMTARKLNITPGTVRNHKKNIFAKLGVSSQGQVFGLFLEVLQTPLASRSDPDPLVSILEQRSPTPSASAARA